jgi:hypothetical protein
MVERVHPPRGLLSTVLSGGRPRQPVRAWPVYGTEAKRVARSLTSETMKREAEPMLGLLQRLQGGHVSVQWGDQPFAELDADRKNVEIDLGPVLAQRQTFAGVLHERRFQMWRTLRFPGALARLNWRVSLRAGDREIVGLGRGTSALTGHVHVELGGLRELARAAKRT